MDKRKCHLVVSSDCVLGKNRKFCCFCVYKVPEIKGITNMVEYLNIAFAKHAAQQAFIISIVSVIISVFVLIVEIIDKTNIIRELFCK